MSTADENARPEAQWEAEEIARGEASIAQFEAERRQEEREYQAHLEEAEQRLRSELAAAGNLLAYLYGPEPEAEP